MKLEDLLKGEERYAGRLAAAALIGLVVLALMAYILAPKGDAHATFQWTINLLFAIVANVFSSLLFVIVVGKRERRALAELMRVAEPGLIRDFFEDLGHYRSIHYYDYSVDVRLVPCRDDHSLVLCKMTHRYRKSRIGKRLEFRVLRVRTAEEYTRLPPMSEACLAAEFVWFNIELDMLDRAKDEYYQLANVSLGAHRLEVREIPQGNGEKRWVAEMTEMPSSDAYLSFDVTVPLEIEDALVLTSEFPAKGAKISFNYASMKDRLKVCSFQKSGIRKNPLVVDEEEDGIIRVESNHWLLPQDAQSFIWWERKNAVSVP